MTTAQIAYYENWKPEWDMECSINKNLNIDMDKVEKLINDGYISVRPHPSAPLFIYNYTRKCQYDWHWTPETI